MSEKILVAMSGGVDSSVALKLLLDRGYFLHGVTFTVGESAETDIKDAASVAASFGIEHTVLDLTEEFRREVKDYFADSYRRGETPIPCVVCNRKIKFGALMTYADSIGCEKIATGHYARTEEKNGRVRLLRSKDPAKDQSYMLSTLSEEQLKRSVFPLGAYTKDEIRELASRIGIKTARKKDSQDICFIPDGDYVKFLTEYKGSSPIPGKYTDKNGVVLGEHKGHETLTVGQGRGLGIALGHRVYVTKKNAECNEVTLGEEAELYRDSVTLRDFHLLGVDSTDSEKTYSVKIRYTRRETDAIVAPSGDGNVAMLSFVSPVRAPAPGQLAVIYDGDYVIASGTIV